MKNVKKGSRRGRVAVLFMLAVLFCVSALAQETDVSSAALSHVPEGSVLLRREKDDGYLEMTYWDGRGQTLYEVKLYPETGEIVKVESDHLYDEGSVNVTLHEQDILALVRELYPDAQNVQITLRTDDGLKAYRAQFATALFTARVDFHPETGVVLESEMDYTRPRRETEQKQQEAKPAAAAKDSSSADSAQISQDQASSIALEKAGGGTVRFIRLERDDGRQVYEGEVINGQYEYEFEIDAENGRIREWDKDRKGDD